MNVFGLSWTSLALSGAAFISNSAFALSSTIPLPSDGVIPAANFYTKTTGGALGASGWDIWANGYIKQTITLPTSGVYSMSVIASGTAAANVWPAMQIAVDGKVIANFSVDPSKQAAYTNSSLTASLPAGNHSVSIAFTNDYYSSTTHEDRNLYVYSLNISQKTTTNNPFTSTSFLVNPYSGPAQAMSSYPAGSSDWNALNTIAQQPMAIWLGDWNSPAVTDQYIAGILKQADATNQMPVIVLYAIPNRDCGSYSSGGFPDKASYMTFIDQVIADIGTHKAVIIYEPDALPTYPDCPTAVGRLDIMSTAIQHLTSKSNLYIYLDVGNPAWKTPAQMNQLIPQVDPKGLVRGYSVNVSNFQTTANNISFCKGLSTGKPCVIDTSRNGNGPTANNQWCNPSGRALGILPTGKTNDTRVDAFLWVKTPGDSDGTCNGGPSAGTFVPSVAIDMAHAAGY